MELKTLKLKIKYHQTDEVSEVIEFTRLDWSGNFVIVANEKTRKYMPIDFKLIEELVIDG